MNLVNMLLRSCVGMVSWYARALLPTVTNSGRVALYSVYINTRKEDQYSRRSTEVVGETCSIVLPFALTRGRKIHTMSEDGEWWKKIEESPPFDELMLDSVVDVYTDSTEYSKVKPWQTLTEESWGGSGFAIAGKKILTTAHVVEPMNDHTSVHVKRLDSQIKYKAKVKKISHECDLAILEIDSDKFWEGMNPLELGDVPPLHEIVYVVGYPEAGDMICVAKGFVTGVDTTKYIQSSTKLLTIQIDGTINHGNSGGPVITGNKVLGIAFESTKCQKRIGTHGFVIPTPIIRHFIASAEESSQNAVFGSLVLSYQSLENDHIRNHFKMSPETTGTHINKINSSSGAHKILKKNDIILAIDGVPIGNDAKVPFQNEERISFNHLVSMKKPYEKILIKVLRKGKEHEYNISLKPLIKSSFVRPHITVQQYYNLPSYYIFGGFVFVPLTKSYIDDLSYMCACVLHDEYKITDEQHVIISQVMSDDINQGYGDFKDLRVKKVNGVKVKNFKHLCELIEGCCSENLRMDLENDKVMVLNYESAKKATFEILERHNIKSAWAIY